MRTKGTYWYGTRHVDLFPWVFLWWLQEYSFWKTKGEYIHVPMLLWKLELIQKGCIGLLSNMHAIGWVSPGCDPWLHPSRSLCWGLGSWSPLYLYFRMMWLPELLALTLFYLTHQCMERRNIPWPSNAWRCSWSRKQSCTHVNPYPSFIRPLILYLGPIPSIFSLKDWNIVPCR